MLINLMHFIYSYVYHLPQKFAFKFNVHMEQFYLSLTYYLKQTDRQTFPDRQLHSATLCAFCLFVSW